MQNKYCPNDGAGLEQQEAFLVCSVCHTMWVQEEEVDREISEKDIN